FGATPPPTVGCPPARDISQRKQGAPPIAETAAYLCGAVETPPPSGRGQDAPSIKKNAAHWDGAVDVSDCEKTSSAPGTSSFTGIASPEKQTYKLTEDIAQATVDSLHKKFNHSYDTFYTFCVCDAEGRQLATNALEHHSVALSEAQRAAADALARAARKGGSDPKAAAVPENGGAALYIYEQLTGSVGVYGAYKKDTNEKAKLLLDALRNMLL
ncbi:MAG: hypothetical protein LUF30_00985, partial [Lachnospiraceae bacterium]|nr:hypothetical protein [Lachnospiraceae bacterium]